MKIVLILFNEDRTHILCGGINSDRFIEQETGLSTGALDVERIMESVGLSARYVSYKLVGYSAFSWVPSCNEPISIDDVNVISEYIVTGIAYNIDGLENGYQWYSIDLFKENAIHSCSYRRLDYLSKAEKVINLQ